MWNTFPMISRIKFMDYYWIRTRSFQIPKTRVGQAASAPDSSPWVQNPSVFSFWDSLDVAHLFRHKNEIKQSVMFSMQFHLQWATGTHGHDMKSFGLCLLLFSPGFPCLGDKNFRWNRRLLISCLWIRKSSSFKLASILRQEAVWTRMKTINAKISKINFIYMHALKPCDSNNLIIINIMNAC